MYKEAGKKNLRILLVHFITLPFLKSILFQFSARVYFRFSFWSLIFFPSNVILIFFKPNEKKQCCSHYVLGLNFFKITLVLRMLEQKNGPAHKPVRTWYLKFDNYFYFNLVPSLPFIGNCKIVKTTFISWIVMKACLSKPFTIYINTLQR